MTQIEEERRVGDLIMQIYNTQGNRKGYSGFTADQLASRLSEVMLEDSISKEIQKEVESRHPKTFTKPEGWIQSEFDNYKTTNKLIDQNPLSNLKNEDKFSVMQSEYKKALIEDVRKRKELGEIIEEKTQNELRAMNIDPSTYIYSKEYEKIEEGQEE